MPNKQAVKKAITVATGVLALWGYFPGKALRMVGDLPKGVMAQWRRWCLDPEYAVGAEGDAVRNTESIHSFYTGAPRTLKRIAPRDIGVARIGHFGFFRTAFESSLWQPHLLPELG